MPSNAPPSKLALKVAPTAKIAGIPVAQGIMRFQFDPETIEERLQFKWDYGEVVNDAFPNPEPTGREPRVISMTLIMLERGIGPTQEPPTADLQFLRDAKRAFEETELIKKSFNDLRGRAEDTISRLKRRRVGGRGAVSRFAGTITTDLRRTPGKSKSFLQTVGFVTPDTQDADVTRQLVAAGGEDQLLSVLQPQEDVLERKVREVGRPTTLPSTASGVDAQLKWLATIMRSHQIFGDQPPRLQLIWKLGDPFTCVLTDASITHRMMHPATKATLHAEVQITLKEAQDNLRPLVGEGGILGISGAT